MLCNGGQRMRILRNTCQEMSSIMQGSLKGYEILKTTLDLSRKSTVKGKRCTSGTNLD